MYFLLFRLVGVEQVKNDVLVGDDDANIFKSVEWICIIMLKKWEKYYFVPTIF